MKRLFTLMAVMTLSIAALMAQAPDFINYQAVARDGNGDIMANQSINVSFIIHSGSAAGPVEFEEDHTSVSTNDFGLFALHVGGGSNVSGSIGTIDWGADSYWLEVEVNGASVGATQLVSVPYAMDAAGPWARNGNELNFMNNVGIGVTNPSYRLHVETSSAAVAQFDGGNGAYIRISEGGTNRAYMGSYSGNPEDADFGTTSGSTGSTHLVTAATPKVTVTASGDVGVGNTSPQYRFQVDGSTGGFSDNGIRIENTSAATGWSFYASSTGNMFIGNTSNLGSFNGTTGAYSALSDARLKTNIQALEQVLPNLMTLEVKRYELINDNPEQRQDIGILAQDLNELYPEFVTVNTANDGNPAIQNQLGVNYAGLSTLAIKAIQEQQTQMEAMQAEIEALKQELEELKK